MIKKTIVITDLDGTFVYDSHKIRLADKKALHKLQKHFSVGIATGRSPKEIDYIETMGHFKSDYKICFNGAIVEDGSGHRLVDCPIPSEDLREVLSYLREKELTFDALDGKCRTGNFQTTDNTRLWGMELICLDDPYQVVSNKVIYKINVRPDAESFAEVYDEMKLRFPYLGIYESDSLRIEVTAANINKGTAIQALKSSYHGIVVGIGDSGNDVPMFQAVDHAFCMSQASSEIQNEAETIVDHFSDLLSYEDLIYSYQEVK